MDVSSRSVLARLCSRDTATLVEWMTWASIPCCFSHLASQNPSHKSASGLSIVAVGWLSAGPYLAAAALMMVTSFVSDHRVATLFGTVVARLPWFRCAACGQSQSGINCRCIVGRPLSWTSCAPISPLWQFVKSGLSLARSDVSVTMPDGGHESHRSASLRLTFESTVQRDGISSHWAKNSRRKSINNAAPKPCRSAAQAGSSTSTSS